MMPHATFNIHLEQPVIVSLQSSSAGTLRSLDFLPGATLLGHVAARLYSRLAPEQAWYVFHSGKLRFGDALPVVAGRVSWPVPLSWHHLKGERASAEGRFLENRVFDLARQPASPGTQPVQLRTGYVASDGRHSVPQRDQTLKTAIDPCTGQAAQGQLFGYEALAAGQFFSSMVTADEDVPVDLWERVLEALTGTARLGRSRSAQFGRVDVARVDEQLLPESADAGSELTLWLLSDLALERDGQPCLQPVPGLLGLPDGSEWNVERSFLRERCYSPYNAYRRHHDPEHQVIRRGSVLRYALPEPLPASELARLRDGLGLYQECGLGRAWVNPRLLATACPAFVESRRVVDTPAATKASQSSSAFVTALRARRSRLDGQGMEDKARDLYARYRKTVGEALRFDALVEPPRPSQWGRLKQLASDYRRHPDKLRHALFDERDGLLRARSGWDLRYGTGANECLHEWMKNELEQAGESLPDLLGHLAAVAVHDRSAFAADDAPRAEESA